MHARSMLQQQQQQQQAVPELKSPDVQGSYFNLTQEWLVRHKYPPGPIHLTRTHLPTLPIYYSVGNFKARSCFPAFGLWGDAAAQATVQVLLGLGAMQLLVRASELQSACVCC